MKLNVENLQENAAELAKLNEIMLADEAAGNFQHDQDVVDPNSYEPVDENFPYIRKGFKWWLKQTFYDFVVRLYSNKINKKLTNLKVVGRENLRGLRHKAAIVTCNHISKVDSFAVRGALKENIMYVAWEHNNWKGYMGDLARNTGLIPLPLEMKFSLMRNFNKAIKYYLDHDKKILIYPEQAMWRNYRKPRPLQSGAFHYAVLNDVPIIPMFITQQDKPEMVDAQGRANYPDYTIHILPPLYVDHDLSVKENEQKLRDQNFAAWQTVYEQTYGEKLKY